MDVLFDAVTQYKSFEECDFSVCRSLNSKECENLYTQKFLDQAQINACTSIDEVNAIEIVFEMMDFSKSDTETDSE